MHCTQVVSQQVAVAVGLEGEPLGKKVLGLLFSVSVGSALCVSGVTGILGGITTSFSFLSAVNHCRFLCSSTSISFMDHSKKLMS